ncbi:MAG: prepilin peptidase [Lactobacillus sp.]|nr:prepilin peptidase [Lactobacillus sp.]MCH4068724.1 prepilin peptidase [Lactobacillus sp.]MCI1303791.1 prepilin peptidase [Lactobacillus sp.]MCI1481466.1 prepilin peptidase [Lactobacillus sp.]MCI1527730.1 prepilin peptidase [Lactobacillus sp.]
MQLLIMLTNAMIGACLGSHACVVAQRFGQANFISARSVCQSCQRSLLLRDEIPLISYLYLKGKCRYCRSFIPARLFYAELLGAASFCKLNMLDSINWPLAAFIFSLLILALQDWETQSIDTLLLIPPILLTLFWPHFAWTNWTISQIWIIVPILLTMGWFIYQGKMGSGDLYLLIIILAFWGSLVGTVILLIACCLFIGYFVCTSQNRQQALAFLPFLYCGQIIYLLWQ